MDLDKAYEIAIADEHYHREMFQNRLGYHTNVVLVALGGLVAALLQAEREWVFRLLGFASLAIGAFALVTPEMIRRIYEHFIEHLDVRERLEVALGLRDPSAVANGIELSRRLGQRPSIIAPTSPTYASGFLFHESWIRQGRGRGYFSWMTWMFRVLGGAAGLAGVLLLLAPASLGVLSGTASADSTISSPTDVLGRVVERSLGTVGPFDVGVTCVTAPLLQDQMNAIASRAQLPDVRHFVVVGAADPLPLAEASAASFGNNTGVALARARCVAGWMSELLVQRGMVSSIDVRVRDALVRTPSARSAGASNDRVVEVFVIQSQH